MLRRSDHAFHFNGIAGHSSLFAAAMAKCDGIVPGTVQ